MVWEIVGFFCELTHLSSLSNCWGNRIEDMFWHSSFVSYLLKIESEDANDLDFKMGDIAKLSYKAKSRDKTAGRAKTSFNPAEK